MFINILILGQNDGAWEFVIFVLSYSFLRNFFTTLKGYERKWPNINTRRIHHLTFATEIPISFSWIPYLHFMKHDNHSSVIKLQDFPSFFLSSKKIMPNTASCLCASKDYKVQILDFYKNLKEQWLMFQMQNGNSL